VTAGFTDRAQPPEPGKLLCWLREALTPVTAPQPFTYTPEFAAALARVDLSRSSPHADVIRRLTMPADFVSIARVNLELTAVLGALRATGRWEAIRCEHDFLRPERPGPAATPLGRQDQAFWREHPGRDTAGRAWPPEQRRRSARGRPG